MSYTEYIAQIFSVHLGRHISRSPKMSLVPS